MRRLFQLQFGTPTREACPRAASAMGAAGAESAADTGADSVGQQKDPSGQESSPGKEKGPAVWSGGAVWALDCLLEPVATRFRFHFEEERPTNRIDSEFRGTLQRTRVYVPCRKFACSSLLSPFGVLLGRFNMPIVSLFCRARVPPWCLLAVRARMVLVVPPARPGSVSTIARGRR